MKNLVTTGMLLILLVGILCGCSSRAAEKDGAIILKLAHNQGETHPVHKSLVEFSKLVEEKTNGEVKVQLYPNGQLGSEREAIELTQTGALDGTKVSASALESFSEVYSIFSLPYLFTSREHYYQVMGSDIAKDIYETTTDLGFRGLTFYDGGSRNFYTRTTAVMHPDDLKGSKIRVQPSATAIEMVELMGGSPTPMSFGEVYTALQQGVIDGSENNETALTDNNHGEVAKYYSYSEHAMVPDILIINNERWNGMEKRHKQAIEEAAKESTAFHKVEWEKAIEEAVELAKEKGVTFLEPDKGPFIEAVQPQHKDFSKRKSTSEYYKRIQDMKPQ